MRREYRIVRDGYLRFELQSRRWLRWSQLKSVNSFRTIEDAEEYARQHAAGAGPGTVAKYLGFINKERD